MKEKFRRQAEREEFSIEFGDVNGIKLFELFAMGQENDRKKDRDESKERKK